MSRNDVVGLYRAFIGEKVDRLRPPHDDEREDIKAALGDDVDHSYDDRHDGPALRRPPVPNAANSRSPEARASHNPGQHE